MTLEELIAARDALVSSIGKTSETVKFGDREHTVQYSDSIKTLAWYDGEIRRLTALASGASIRCTIATFRND